MFKRLDAKGFSHHLLLFIIPIIAVAAIGAYVLSKSGASSTVQGQLTAPTGTYTLSSGWTSVLKLNSDPSDVADELVFYNGATGQVSGYQNSTATGLTGKIYDVKANAGWAAVLGANIDGDKDDELVYYNKSTGALAFYGATATTTGTKLTTNATTVPGYDLVVAMDIDGNNANDELMFYNKSTGATKLYKVTAAGIASAPYGSFTLAAGWDAIAGADFNGNGDDEATFYRRSDGLLKVYDSVGSSGVSGEMANFTIDKTWTAVVGANLKNTTKDNLYFYNSATGAVKTYDGINFSYVPPTPTAGTSPTPPAPTAYKGTFECTVGASITESGATWYPVTVTNKTDKATSTLSEINMRGQRADSSWTSFNGSANKSEFSWKSGFSGEKILVNSPVKFNLKTNNIAQDKWVFSISGVQYPCAKITTGTGPSASTSFTCTSKFPAKLTYGASTPVAVTVTNKSGAATVANKYKIVQYEKYTDKTDKSSYGSTNVAAMANNQTVTVNGVATNKYGQKAGVKLTVTASLVDVATNAVITSCADPVTYDLGTGNTTTPPSAAGVKLSCKSTFPQTVTNNAAIVVPVEVKNVGASTITANTYKLVLNKKLSGNTAAKIDTTSTKTVNAIAANAVYNETLESQKVTLTTNGGVATYDVVVVDGQNKVIANCETYKSYDLKTGSTVKTPNSDKPVIQNGSEDVGDTGSSAAPKPKISSLGYGDGLDLHCVYRKGTGKKAVFTAVPCVKANTLLLTVKGPDSDKLKRNQLSYAVDVSKTKVDHFGKVDGCAPRDVIVNGKKVNYTCTIVYYDKSFFEATGDSIANRIATLLRRSKADRDLNQSEAKAAIAKIKAAGELSSYKTMITLSKPNSNWVSQRVKGENLVVDYNEASAVQRIIGLAREDCEAKTGYTFNTTTFACTKPAPVTTDGRDDDGGGTPPPAGITKVYCEGTLHRVWNDSTKKCTESCSGGYQTLGAKDSRGNKKCSSMSSDYSDAADSRNQRQIVSIDCRSGGGLAVVGSQFTGLFGNTFTINPPNSSDKIYFNNRHYTCFAYNWFSGSRSYSAPTPNYSS